jgi:heme A synthase
MTSSPAARSDAGRAANPGATKLFAALVGLAALAVLLQGVWAGMFVRERRDYSDTWVAVHSTGANVAILLALVATVVAVVRLRGRRELWIGSLVFTVLLALEAVIGGLVGDHPGLAALHFPLALALMGLAVWLPLRSTRG